MVRELESDAFRRHPALIEIKAPDTSEVPNLNEQREKIVSWLIKESKETEEGLRIERLRRFLSADLTRYEIELLASNFASQGLEVHRLWKNAQKRALITRSVDTVQARPPILATEPMAATSAGRSLIQGLEEAIRTLQIQEHRGGDATAQKEVP